MSPTSISVVLSIYLALNFSCALVLHRHAERQAHLPLRFMDVFVHFVFLTAFAIPVLLVITAEALFGSKHQPKLPRVPEVVSARTRAA